MEFKEKSGQLNSGNGLKQEALIEDVATLNSPEADKLAVLESLLGASEGLNDSKDTIKEGRLARQ